MRLMTGSATTSTYACMQIYIYILYIDRPIMDSESDTDRMQTQPKTGWLSQASQAKQGHRKNTGSDG